MINQYTYFRKVPSLRIHFFQKSENSVTSIFECILEIHSTATFKSVKSYKNILKIFRLKF